MNCAYCQRISGTLHRDHVVPRSRGGPDAAFNIVMACELCNSEKRDKTAMEWLGEQCPDEVRQIEDRVNARLARDFAKRDSSKRKQSMPQYVAFHAMPNGNVDYAGEIVSETEETLSIQILDAFMATGCGMWCPSGEVKVFLRQECRIWKYEHRIDCLETMLRINQLNGVA